MFKVGSTTIKGWKTLRLETGSLETRELKRQAKVYDSKGLRTYIDEHPLASLKEIAKHFGGFIPSADNALKREKLT